MAESLLGRITNKVYQFKEISGDLVENLSEAKVNVEYIIKSIETNDEEMKNFLFTLGCYEGEEITIISILADNYVISLKDARYSIDSELAKAIII
ncbi:FeoA family protein [Senegalia sp. (in: firmicutes)]|uniref:FeoA family protein n=1 Tax=Senegalia sp. (in: firmicutes) TaxID=1924098 RepID=UPI003F981B68